MVIGFYVRETWKCDSDEADRIFDALKDEVYDIVKYHKRYDMYNYALIEAEKQLKKMSRKDRKAILDIYEIRVILRDVAEYCEEVYDEQASID